MRKLWWLPAIAAAFAVTGCSGGGDGGNNAPIDQYTRVVVGYVYVENNVNPGAAPDVVITNSTTAPDGYFAPTAGTVRIAVGDGEITRAPDFEDFNMATSNAIIAAVTSTEQGSGYPLTISTPSTLQLNGTNKSFSTTSISLNGDAGAEGTVRTIVVGTPAYTPGAPASIQILVRNNNGNPGSATNAYTSPETATGGLFISGNSYEMATVAFDANGVAIPGVTFNVTSSDASVDVTNSGTRLVPDVETGAVAGTTATITVGIVGPPSTLTESFSSNFDYGTVTTVNVNTADASLEWEVSGGSVNSTNVDIEVLNQFGAGMPGQGVDMTIANNPGGSAKLTGNVWNTTAAGNAFGSLNLGPTANDGTISTTFSTPNPVDGDLGGTAGLNGDSVPKANNIITATVGSVSGSDIVVITRPLGDFDIVGPDDRDTGTSTQYTIANAVDVDNDSVANPTVTWSVVNTTGAGTVGNVGDESPQSTAVASINGSGVLSSGNVAGEVDVTATSTGTPVVAVTKTVQIYGNPVKVVLTPNTAASVIAGASGEYAGNPTDTQAFTISLIDAWGHTIAPARYQPFTSTSSISSTAAGSITPGGSNVSNFTVTFGTSDGTFTVAVNGTYTGGFGGGSTVFGLTRTVGLNVP
jgi:hypothetical protein